MKDNQILPACPPGEICGAESLTPDLRVELLSRLEAARRQAVESPAPIGSPSAVP